MSLLILNKEENYWNLLNILYDFMFLILRHISGFFLVMVMLVTLQYSVNLFRIMIVRNNSFESVHIFVYQHSLIGVNLQFATTTFNINQLLQLIAFYREKNERCNRSWMRKRSRLSSYRKHIPHYNRKWKWKQRS